MYTTSSQGCNATAGWGVAVLAIVVIAIPLAQPSSGRLPSVQDAGASASRSTTGLAVPLQTALSAPVAERVSVSSSGKQTRTDVLTRTRASDNGRFVAFSSASRHLVRHDTNGEMDVFIRDRLRGKTLLVSVNGHGGGLTYGGYLADMTPDGRYVLFNSSTPRMFNRVWIYDRFDKSSTKIRRASTYFGAAGAGAVALSADARFIAFSTEDDLVPRDHGHGFSASAYVYDRGQRTVRLMSIDNRNRDVGDANAHDVSAGGRFVAFTTRNPSKVFVRDRVLHLTRHISVSTTGRHQRAHFSWDVSVSDRGRFVAFMSTASNLVRGDSNDKADVFVRDRKKHRTFLVSVGKGGGPARGESGSPSISGNGRYVVFASRAANLVPHDRNGTWDVFVRDRRTGITRVVSSGQDGRSSAARSFEGAVAASSDFVSFVTRSPLASDDTNRVVDAYVTARPD